MMKHIKYEVRIVLQYSILVFQDELYQIFTIKCREFLENCSLDINSNTVISFSKITPVRAVETLLNLYLLHLQSNELTPVIDGLITYSLHIFTRAENGSIDDEISDQNIVDLSTWNIKSTFLIYFRGLFKHFIIKARSIRLPNESKKKNELEKLCTEWLELNELFRKFVSFVTLDRIYSKNALVNLSSSFPFIRNIHLGSLNRSSLFQTIHRCFSSSSNAHIRSILSSRYLRNQTTSHSLTKIHTIVTITL